MTPRPFRDLAFGITLLARSFSKHFSGTLITCQCIALGFSAYWLYHSNGEILPGVRLAVTTDAAEVLRSQAAAETAKVQAALRIVGETDRVINEALAGLVNDTPHAARSRVALIHDGVFTMTGAHMMHFSTTNAVAAPGAAAGDFQQGMPLSQWSDFLADIINHPSCAFRHTGQITHTAALYRMHQQGVGGFLVCSVASSRGQLLGGLFTSFDRADDFPSSGPERDELIRRHLLAAAAIGAALDARLAIANR